MVGGKVIEIIQLEDRTWINCQERNGREQCAIYVKKTEHSILIQIGDSLWWQGLWAYWTPVQNATPSCGHDHHISCQNCGIDYDIKLERIGHSGVNRPSVDGLYRLKRAIEIASAGEIHTIIQGYA